MTCEHNFHTCTLDDIVPYILFFRTVKNVKQQFLGSNLEWTAIMLKEQRKRIFSLTVIWGNLALFYKTETINQLLHTYLNFINTIFTKYKVLRCYSTNKPILDYKFLQNNLRVLHDKATFTSSTSSIALVERLRVYSLPSQHNIIGSVYIKT